MLPPGLMHYLMICRPSLHPFVFSPPSYPPALHSSPSPPSLPLPFSLLSLHQGKTELEQLNETGELRKVLAEFPVSYMYTYALNDLSLGILLCILCSVMRLLILAKCVQVLNSFPAASVVEVKTVSRTSLRLSSEHCGVLTAMRMGLRLARHVWKVKRTL